MLESLRRHQRLRFVKPSVRESLAFDPLERDFGALRIVEAQCCAGVHAEIKLREVAIQMLLVHVLVRAYQPALEDAEEAFQRVGMNIAARPLEFAVVNRLVLDVYKRQPQGYFAACQSSCGYASFR